MGLFNPSTFVEGGLIDDADVIFAENRFVRWDYNGKTAAVLALRVKMVDDDGTEHLQYFSAGDLENFVPSDDGLKALPVGNATGLNKNSNFTAMLVSLMACDTEGAFAKKIEDADTIDVIDGIKVHIKREAAPKRTGILVQEGEGQRAQTILKVTKIIHLPGQGEAAKPAAAKAAAAKAAGKAAPAAAANSDVASEAEGLVLGFITDTADNTLLRKNIAGLLVAATKGNPNSSAIMKLATSKDFVGHNDRPWQYDAPADRLSIG